MGNGNENGFFTTGKLLIGGIIITAAAVWLNAGIAVDGQSRYGILHFTASLTVALWWLNVIRTAIITDRYSPKNFGIVVLVSGLILLATALMSLSYDNAAAGSAAWLNWFAIVVLSPFAGLTELMPGDGMILGFLIIMLAYIVMGFVWHRKYGRRD